MSIHSSPLKEGKVRWKTQYDMIPVNDHNLLLLLLLLLLLFVIVIVAVVVVVVVCCCCLLLLLLLLYVHMNNRTRTSLGWTAFSVVFLSTLTSTR